MTNPRTKWTTDARYFEYSKVVNSVGHQTPKCPTADFNHCLHEEGESRIIPLDLSGKLLCPSPATSPNLCANFIRIKAGERITTSPNAMSQLYSLSVATVRQRSTVKPFPGVRTIFSPYLWARPRTSPNPRPLSTGFTTHRP
jgi:hypothetical protein